MTSRDSTISALGRIAANVRRYRKIKGITQLQLSIDSGVALSQISAIEAGGQNITVDTLVRVGNVLDVTLKDLVS